MTAQIEGLRELQAEMRAVHGEVVKAASAVVKRAAVEVKRGAQQRIRGQITGRRLPHYTRSIDFDMVDRLTAEIGPNSSQPQGKLGRGVEFGSVHTAPHPHMLPAADAEEPQFYAAMARAIGELFR